LALGVISVNVRFAHAAGNEQPSVPSQATDDEKPSADEGPDRTSDPKRPRSGTSTAPNLQLQDDSPVPDDSRSVRLRRASTTTTDDAEERPFWKSWVFWTVTGVLIAGAVGVGLYASSGTNTSLAPCPPEVVVSLGCFGAGR
jgi:hypothetical protein